MFLYFFSASYLDGSQNCRHIVCWTPSVLKNVQAYAAICIDCNTSSHCLLFPLTNYVTINLLYICTGIWAFISAFPSSLLLIHHSGLLRSAQVTKTMDTSYTIIGCPHDSQSKWWSRGPSLNQSLCPSHELPVQCLQLLIQLNLNSQEPYLDSRTSCPQWPNDN